MRPTLLGINPTPLFEGEIVLKKFKRESERKNIRFALEKSFKLTKSLLPPVIVIEQLIKGVDWNFVNYLSKIGEKKVFVQGVEVDYIALNKVSIKRVVAKGERVGVLLLNRKEDGRGVLVLTSYDADFEKAILDWVKEESVSSSLEFEGELE